MSNPWGVRVIAGQNYCPSPALTDGGRPKLGRRRYFRRSRRIAMTLPVFIDLNWLSTYLFREGFEQ